MTNTLGDIVAAGWEFGEGHRKKECRDMIMSFGQYLIIKCPGEDEVAIRKDEISSITAYSTLDTKAWYIVTKTDRGYPLIKGEKAQEVTLEDILALIS